MKIQPFGERIVVKIVKPEERTAGGLLMVSVVSVQSSKRGIVEAIGDDVKEYVKVGDLVIFNTNSSGIKYTDCNEDYVILNIRDVYGKVISEERVSNEEE